MSTDEVCGSLGESGRVHEEWPYAPNGPYSASKAGSDHPVWAYHHTLSLPTLTSNCLNNYDPRQHPEELIPLAIARMAKHELIPVYGDGQNVWDWLFVEDHCAAIETVIAKGTPGETCCIGGDNEWMNLDLIHLLCDTVDQHFGCSEGTRRKQINFVKDRVGHDRRYAIDAAKVQREIGWAPAEKFEDRLRETVIWYLR